MLIRRDPFRELLSLRRTMDRMRDRNQDRTLEEWSDGETHWINPYTDMYETDDNLVIQIDLPGLKPDDVDITINGDMLNIKGEFKEDNESNGNAGSVTLRERRYGFFRRNFRLPSGVDADHVDAVFDQGVLKLTLPKVEEAKTKQIEIKTNA